MAAAVSRIGKVIAPIVLGKVGTMDKASLIVKGGRFAYIGSATWITLLGYAGWRNQRIKAGDKRYPFPGVDRLKAKYPVDRPDTDTDPGYAPQGVSQFGAPSGSGKPGQDSWAGLGGLSQGGGTWGGTKPVADALTEGLGLSVMSAKRSTQTTSSGGVSDHWTGCRQCYAKDMTGPVSAMDRGARQIMSRLGAHYSGGTLEHTTTKGQFRIQILYRTLTGGDHYDHIHVGIRRVGYVP